MEDAQVNLGLVEAEPWDLARLLVAEFALTYGNDWLVVPIDVPFGSLTTVESVLYTTTFGERFVVKPTAEVSPDGQWRMFTITTPEGKSSDGLLIAPSAVAVQEGQPVEEVLFLRDEMANMCWAVERSVQGPSGAARDRGRERDEPAAARSRTRRVAPNSTTSCRPAFPRAGSPISRAPRDTGRSSSYRAQCRTLTATPSLHSGGCSTGMTCTCSTTPRSPARASPCAANRL